MTSYATSKLTESTCTAPIKDAEIVKEYFICDCHSESLLVEYFADDKEFYLSIWQRGYASRKYTFLQKLCAIWQIITTGSPFNDQLILNKDEATKLSKFLYRLTHPKRK